MKSLWTFRQRGQSGKWASDLFPEMAKRVDDVCWLHGMQTEGVAHGPATLFLHTGATNLIRPSMGSWISYGLGAENENLPAFVVLTPIWSSGAAAQALFTRMWSSGFLPGKYTGVALRHVAHPVPVFAIRLAEHQHAAGEAGDQFQHGLE